MDIVVDTSAIIAVIADEPERPTLLETTRGVDLMAPMSVHWEIGNAFSAMLRRNRAALTDALQALEIYARIPIRFVDVELEDSLEIANALGIYAYDAYLIRCALRYGAPLLTLDAGLFRAAQAANAKVIEVNR